MDNMIFKTPYVYLAIFCLGSLIVGFEMSNILENGFPKEKTNFYLSVSGLLFNSTLTLYFFYRFVKLKIDKGRKN